MARFKQKWTPELQDYASQQEQEYNLPEGSLHQLISQESAGYTDAVSKAGARGLTQLMPGTAKEMGVTDITDPYQQIAGGAKYYSQMLEKAQGNPIIAAGMYNSGPNRSAYRTGNLNMLPVETQNYMKKFATEYGGYQPKAKSIGEKILNAVIPPAQASETGKGMTDAELNQLFAKQSAELNQAPVAPTAPQPSASKGMTDAELNQLFAQQSAELNQAPVAPTAPIGLKPTGEKPSIPQRTLMGALGEAPSNLFGSGVNYLSNIKEAVVNYPETIKSLSKVATGEIQKVIPGPSPFERLGIASDTGSAEAANAFNEALKNRYGSEQAIYNTIATDPVGMIADLYPVGKGLGKAAKPVIEKQLRKEAVSSVASSYGGGPPASTPLTNIVKAVEPIKPYVEKSSDIVSAIASPSKTVAKGISYPYGLLTGVEQPSLELAAKAGYSSPLSIQGLFASPEQKAYLAGKSGAVSDTEVVNQAKSALSNMRQDMSQQYRDAMSTLPGATKPINPTIFRSEFNQLSDIGTHRGFVTNPSVTPVKNKIDEALIEFEANPGLHNVMGADALKRRIGDIRDTTEPHTPERVFATKMYKNVVDNIKRKSTGYANIMEDYSSKITDINNIQKELSLGENVNPGTALRKLQSVMRNNANTAWGYRAEMLDKIKEAGAPTIDYSLAGQALSSYLPRGLSKYFTGSGIAAAGATGLTTLPQSLGLGLLSSPQVAGSLANMAGKGARVISTGTGEGLPLRGSLLDYQRQQEGNQ